MATIADQIAGNSSDFLSPKFINNGVTNFGRNIPTVTSSGGSSDLFGKNPSFLDILHGTKDTYTSIISGSASIPNTGSVLPPPNYSHSLFSPNGYIIPLISGNPPLQGNNNPLLWQNPQASDVMFGSLFGATNILYGNLSMPAYSGYGYGAVFGSGFGASMGSPSDLTIINNFYAPVNPLQVLKAQISGLMGHLQLMFS